MNHFHANRHPSKERKGARYPAVRRGLALWSRARRGTLSRRLRKRRIPATIWFDVEKQIPLVARFGHVPRMRLRILASQILWQKTFSPAQGMILTETIKACLASQIAIVIFGLENTGRSSLVWLRNWREVIVYPAPFRSHRQQRSAIGGSPLGLVSHTDPVELGETSYQGPLVVQWQHASGQRVLRQAPGQVMIHELAHKLDMLDGSSNGHPPLHASMDHQLWHDTLQAAYKHLNHRLESGHKVGINSYAATNPAEFFAVCSEYFFNAPKKLYTSYPDVYKQLSLFYRRQPPSQLV
jgi:Mlc titration factor MtfA (ptsG expression regulator)